MKHISIVILLFLSLTVTSQETISLEECYTLVNKNYPLAKQQGLLAKQNELDLAVIKTEKLPTLDFSAQATYQSDVIELPITIPNVTIESPNKDQYKATVSINQLIYSGGLVDANLEVKSASLKTQQKQLEVNLYQLKEQVNQLYFSILLLQEKKSLLVAKKTQLETTLKEVKAGVKFGMLLPTSDSVLEAELLKIAQQFNELDLNKTSLIETLSELIGQYISTEILLENPVISSNLDTELKRPELDLFQLQKDQIEASEQLIAKKNSPKLMGFATGGYGNPGLNMLDNSFQTYYMTGLKLNWNIFDWNAAKKERKSLQINKEFVDNQQELFTLNTNIELNQQLSEIKKISSFIESDKTIIELRKKILKSANSQLKNGVITSSAYITELTNLYEAENNLNTHKIQLLLAKANFKTTKGE
jgi:outer membrane protein TolC